MDRALVSGAQSLVLSGAAGDAHWLAQGVRDRWLWPSQNLDDNLGTEAKAAEARLAAKSV